MVDVPTADIRRERIALPLLRDERLELQVRELTRIVAERSGQAVDTNADVGAEPGFDLLPTEAPSLPIGFGVHDKPVPRPKRPTMRRLARRRQPRPPRHPHAPGTAARDATEPSAELVPPFDLPSELAIDTDIARRVIGEFIRGQLEQAGFERAVLGLSGGSTRRSWAISSPRRSARAASGGDDAVPHIVAGLARRRRVGHRGSRVRQRPRRHQPDGRWLFRQRDGAGRRGNRRRDSDTAAPRATSPPGCGWRCCTTDR
jgi:hypothetical protein